MKKMSKVLALILMIVFVVACSNGSSKKDEKTLLVVTNRGDYSMGKPTKDKNGNETRDPETAYLRKISDKFEKDTGVKVTLKDIADYKGTKQLLSVGDTEMDVVVDTGALTPEEMVEYFEPLYDSQAACEKEYKYCGNGLVDDKVYSVNAGYSYLGVVVYNEEVLKSVGYDGIPATLAEFNTMAEKLVANGITPMALHRIENWPLENFNIVAQYHQGIEDPMGAMLASETPFSKDGSPVGYAISVMGDWKTKK
ncbi:MAG: extracellular solute-binding protein, partial [Bacilli bacterium]